MTLLVLAYLGGVLTILSPCILPVLPFMFARAGQPFASSTLPMLLGMALAFSTAATLAAIGGGWAVHANQAGQGIAIAMLAVFGATLLWPRVADLLARPAVGLANRLLAANGGPRAVPVPAPARAMLLGLATGLLWAPCAGPILGLVLTAAALHGASVRTALLLAVYSAGAATSLAAALLAGGRAFAGLRRSLGAGEWLRRGLGVAVLSSVAAIGLHLDTRLLAALPGTGMAALEQALLDAFQPRRPAAPAVATAARNGLMRVAAEARPAAPSGLPVEGRLPSLDGAVAWLNSPALSGGQLQGRVVLVSFWTYSCINCIRTIPHIRAWADKYKDQGLTVIGVHTPEFAFEKETGNVRKAIGQLGVRYPVAVDSDFRIWRAFGNSYWPALYVVDAQGRIRHHQFGEGGQDRTEAAIRALLAETGQPVPAARGVAPEASGAQAAPDPANLRSFETYVGYREATGFASPEGVRADAPRDYTIAAPRLNHWGLAGNWTVSGEQATLNRAGGSIVYRFRARDLHLVLGPGADGRAARMQVLVDGRPPGNDHGADVDAGGNGTVTQTRLYQLVRQAGEVSERTVEVRFLDPGAQAFAFTFG